MKLLLIFIFYYFIQKIRGQPIIGIHPDFLVQKSGLNIQSYTFVPMNNLDEYTLRNLTFQYIIYTYDQMLVVLTHKYSVPYLVIAAPPLNIQFPYNVFYVPGIPQVSSDCTKAILIQLNITSVVFIDYSIQPKFENNSEYSNFTQTIISIGNTTDLSTLFVQQIPYNTYDVFVCGLPLERTDLITNLLNEAMIKGQLNPGKSWIFVSGALSDDGFSVFKPYVNVGANIFSFGIRSNTPIPVNTDFTKLIVEDLISIINISISNPPISNSSASLRNSVLRGGKVVDFANFDPKNNRYNGTVVVIKKVNTQGPSIDIFYCTTNLTQVNSNIFAPRLNSPFVIVRIGVIISKGYFMQKPTGQYYGFSVAILERLLNMTKFNYVFVFPNNSGSQAPHDQFNGLLLNNLVDLILIPIYSPFITNMSYLSGPVSYMTMNMLTRDADLALRPITLSPFTYNVWFGILLIILLMTLAFWAISALSPSATENQLKKAKPYSFGFSLLVIYSSFVMAKLKIKILKPSTQIFAFILWFSTLTVIITYVSNILPFLMTTNPNFPFNNATYFFKNPTSGYRFGFVNNSDDIRIIQGHSILRDIYNSALAEYPSNMFFNDSISESALNISGKILLQNSNKNSYIYNTQNCSSSMLIGTFDQFPLVLAMNNNWTLKEEMKNLIDKLISTGVTGTLALIYFGQGTCARTTTQNLPSPVTLHLNKMFILFLFPLMGCLFGIGFVLLATSLGKCGRCVHNLKREKFNVGQKYDAKVHSIEPRGVWAFINNRDRPYYINSTSLHPDLRKQYTPDELGIKSGDILHLKYFGNDPVNGYKRFCKDFTDA